MSIAIDLISQVTATVEPVNSNGTLEDRMREYRLDPAKATIRNGIILEYRGDVDLSRKGLTKIPFRFVKVTGYFDCSCNLLASLAGCPKEVGRSFFCSRNHLTSLARCPEKVSGNFWCEGNLLISLADGPEKIGGNFWCRDNLGSADFKKPKGVSGKFYNV